VVLRSPAATTQGLAIIKAAHSGMDIVATRPGSDTESLDASRYTDAGTGQVEPQRPKVETFSDVKTHTTISPLSSSLR
jgi:hypothetical protein